MSYKICNTTCPLIKKPVSVRIDFEDRSVCGSDETYPIWVGYACNLQMKGECIPSQQCDEAFECPVFAQAIR